MPWSGIGQRGGERLVVRRWYQFTSMVPVPFHAT